MLRFGLIGEKLGHSFSIPIHEAIYRLMGVEADYRRFEIAPERFHDDVRFLLSELDGFNVTIPYKQTILPMLHRLDGFAERIGAVNTVVCNDATGYNTDAPGFVQMLRIHGIDPGGQHCYILGTGGASKAVYAALEDMGAAEVTLVSRRETPNSISYAQLKDEFSGMLVNCTPVGMWPKTDACPLDQETLSVVMSRATGVADVIYNPEETVLTKAARRHGIPACTGMAMLAAQALEAEKLWLGRDIPMEILPDLMREAKV